jgi:hypothetical protein
VFGGSADARHLVLIAAECVGDLSDNPLDGQVRAAAAAVAPVVDSTPAGFSGTVYIGEREFDAYFEQSYDAQAALR